VTFGRRKDPHFPLSNPIPLATPPPAAIAQALYGPFDPAAARSGRTPGRQPERQRPVRHAFRYLATG
jgi:hypothetical protein